MITAKTNYNAVVERLTPEDKEDEVVLVQFAGVNDLFVIGTLANSSFRLFKKVLFMTTHRFKAERFGRYGRSFVAFERGQMLERYV